MTDYPRLSITHRIGQPILVEIENGAFNISTEVTGADEVRKLVIAYLGEAWMAKNPGVLPHLAIYPEAHATSCPERTRFKVCYCDCGACRPDGVCTCRHCGEWHPGHHTTETK